MDIWPENQNSSPTFLLGASPGPPFPKYSYFKQLTCPSCFPILNKFIWNFHHLYAYITSMWFQIQKAQKDTKQSQSLPSPRPNHPLLLPVARMSLPLFLEIFCVYSSKYIDSFFTFFTFFLTNTNIPYVLFCTLLFHLKVYMKTVPHRSTKPPCI